MTTTIKIDGVTPLLAEDGVTDLLAEDGFTILVIDGVQDVSSSVRQGSMVAKFNTVDLTLLNVAAPAIGASVVLTDPAWSGTVASAQTVDLDDVQNITTLCRVTATNTNLLPNDTAPFDLSDVPSAAPPFDYLLEDGSGHYLLEAGTDWQPGALMLEGALAYGYAGLSVQTFVNPGGPNKTMGRARVYQPGLRPGNTFHLTSQNQGYLNAPFQVTQVYSQWPQLSTTPVFDIEFGDTAITLAAWTAAHAVPVVPSLTPPGTIPAGPVTYGAVTAAANRWPMGGGIVTIATSTFTVNVAGGHTMTVQVQGAIDCVTYAWDNYVAAPRRGVRATLSGGIYTGAWQETPFGFVRQTYDLSSAAGIALPSGTYTVTIDINTVEYNQIQVYSGWVQAIVTTV